MTKPPCRGCESRTITCHGVCKEYIAWQKIHEEEKKTAEMEMVWCRSLPRKAFKKWVQKLKARR